MSLKVQTNLYENNVFYGGDILCCHRFVEKPYTKKIDGKWIENPSIKVWWLEDYTVVPQKEFDKILDTQS